MDLSHRFTLPVGIDEAWRALTNLEWVTPCVPGATLGSVDGNTFTGSVKVKLGPISLFYLGTGAIVERDARRHRAVVEAKGRDQRGNGKVSMAVTMRLTPAQRGTTVTVDTDLAINGKPAQLGSDVVQEVSNRLMDRFVNSVSTKLGVTTTPEPGLSAVAAGEAGAGGERTAGSPKPEVVGADEVGKRRQARALSMLRSYAAPTLGALVVLVALLVIVRKILRRSR
ncbi:hypothetical protein GCM10009841_25590 [Microlunatus panaciterrae]|uniref:Carbon monoxide dehydrogenase subunit G n=1 Tax=Microlunatus panaciterrae TaxID=400768 RepID=A0ABS2REM4_9ACTN|nr:SRPBCC family protein [Microlunatus panaciterrae]MBM7797441.1 carbon monoxide dehydrogenase subunit G [Microlunatus panaciterrae]